MTAQGKRIRIALVWLFRLLFVLALFAAIDHAMVVIGSGGLAGRPDVLVYTVLSGFVMAFGAFALSESLAIESGVKSAIAIRREAVWLARGSAIVLLLLTILAMAGPVSGVSEMWGDFGGGAAFWQIINGLYGVLHAPLFLLGFAEVLHSARPRSSEGAA